MIKALVPFADGLEEIEAVTIVDILRRGGVTVVTASIGSSLSVRGAHSLVLQADAMFSDVTGDSFDALILPGGGEGTDNLKKCSQLIEMIVRQRQKGRCLAAICAAPTVFSVAEVFIPGQHATCYPTCPMQLDCQWVNQPVVEHGGIITGKAPGSAALFSLVLLKALVGERTAIRVAREMDIEF